MRKQPKLRLEDKLCFLAITIFCFGMALMLNFGEMPFLVCLAFSLCLVTYAVLHSHRRENSKARNRYLP